MEVQALTKFERMSAHKVRQVARVIQGRPANEAQEMLKFIPKKSARLLAKTLHSAIANAENTHNLASDRLFIRQATADQGPALKRFRAGPRGSAMPRRKPTCHLRIILSDGAAG
jgi:large subunit ribosomal protein L22